MVSVSHLIHLRAKSKQESLAWREMIRTQAARRPQAARRAARSASSTAAAAARRPIRGKVGSEFET